MDVVLVLVLQLAILGLVNMTTMDLWWALSNSVISTQKKEKVHCRNRQGLWGELCEVFMENLVLPWSTGFSSSHPTYPPLHPLQEKFMPRWLFSPNHWCKQESGRPSILWHDLTSLSRGYQASRANHSRCRNQLPKKAKKFIKIY